MEKFYNFLAGLIIPFPLFLIFIHLPWVSKLTISFGPAGALIFYYAVCLIPCLFVLAFIQNKIGIKELKLRMTYFTGAYILAIILSIVFMTFLVSVLGNFGLY